MERKFIRIETTECYTCVDTGTFVFPIYGIKPEVVEEVLVQMLSEFDWNINKICGRFCDSCNDELINVIEYLVEGEDISYVDEVVDICLSTLEIAVKFFKDEYITKI